MDEDKEEESTSAGLQGELIGSPFLVPPRHDNLDRRTAEERDRITRMLLNVSADVELQFPTDDAERRAAMLLERQGIAFLLSSPDAASPTRLSATVSLPLSNWAEYPDFACYLRWRENTDVTIGPAAPSGSYDYYSATVQTARRSAPQPGESLIFGSCDGEDDVFGLIRLDRYLNGSEHVHGYEAGERMFDATVYAFGDATRLASGSRLRRRIDWYENSTVFSRSPLDGATASVRFPVCIDNEIAKVHTVRSNTG